MKLVRYAITFMAISALIAGCGNNQQSSGNSGGAAKIETEAAADGAAQAGADGAAQGEAAEGKDENASGANSGNGTGDAATGAFADAASNDGEKTSDGANGGAAVYDFYKEIEEIPFEFSSGVGAWQTGININADGTFNGAFYDANMGENSEEYKNGTIYECVFKGQLSEPVKVDDTTWKATVESIDYDNKTADGQGQIRERQYALHSYIAVWH